MRVLALEVSVEDSIQAWSVGVPGRPKCWAIAHSARNSRVEPEVICGPLSETASRIGRVSSSSAEVDPAVVVAGVDGLEQSFGV